VRVELPGRAVVIVGITDVDVDAPCYLLADHVTVPQHDGDHGR
jgi:uncharacterized lipoprotein YbaY